MVFESSVLRGLNIESSTEKRIESIDALRGFDMFLIIGATSLLRALHNLNEYIPTWRIAGQLVHVPWEGINFYDIVFPLFLFLVGSSIVFSMSKAINYSTEKQLFSRILQRTLLLFILGIIYNGGLKYGLDEMRIMGVLQRIALCYFFTSILVLFFSLRGLIVTFFTILLGYWVAFLLIPVPGVESGQYLEGMNLANYIDNEYLPFRKNKETYDSEGLISTIPAVATTLMGVFAGLILKTGSIHDNKKGILLFGIGVVAIILGYLWGNQFPIIKKIWTSSYVLVVGGYSFLLLSLFYQIVDIWKFSIWARPFIWIGANALTIYLAYNIINIPLFAERFVGAQSIQAFSSYWQLIHALTVIALGIWLARYLYRKNIFIRI